MHKSLPLTPLQAGLLFHVIREPHSSLYLEQITCTLDGSLDEPAFAGAWQHLVDRHDALRTAIEWRAGAATQVIHSAASVPLETVDLSALEGASQARPVADLAARDQCAPFELSRPPLMRVTVVRLGPDRRVLLWTHHHVILDGWSVGLLVDEVLTIYAAFANGRTPSLPPAQSFEPFVDWLATRDRASGMEYWARRLQDVRSPTIIPADVHHGVGGEAASCSVRLTENEHRALLASARAAGCTTFTATAAGWALVLAAATSQRDVMFGVTVAGRPSSIPNVESMVGLFINTIPLRATLDLGEDARQWLRRFEDEKRTAVDLHAHMPLADVLKLARAGDAAASDTPFNTLLVFENYPLPHSVQASAGLTLRDIRAAERTNYDLTLIVVPTGGFEVTLLFNPRRHSAITARRLLRNLRSALARIAELSQRTRPVADLLEPAGAERHRLLVEYGRGRSAGRGPAPADASGRGPRIEELVWERCRKTPEAIAVSCGQVHWTCAHLRRQALSLAARLVSMHVGPEDRVALCVRRGPWLVGGALASMEAGACYVPIDVTWPSDRQRRVAADAGARVVLVDTDNAGMWSDAGFAAVAIGSASACATPEHAAAESRPRPALTDRGLAYVMYTSGSTGKPKGVMLEHAGIVNRLRWMQRAYRLDRRDRVLQKTPATFDVSVWELFWPLIEGARLVLAPPEAHRFPRAIGTELRRRRITTVHFVPPMLQALLDDAGADGDPTATFRRLRHVICSGETLPAQLVRRFWSVAGLRPLVPDGRPVAGLHNLYGPTEASIDVSAWRCDAVADGQASAPQTDDLTSVPIGRPIDGMELYVVDRRLRPVMGGAEGELCIGGIGVARGYLSRPSLTAERFIPNPFCGSGTRLYRTGDLARWRPDGPLNFLGRMDQQVKVRGVRVEPGEVEHTLAAHPSVLAAVVVPRPLGDGGLRLVAYVVRRDRSVPWRNARAVLIEWMAERLPASFLPADVMDLPEVPLNENGKLDRTSLPVPEGNARLGEPLSPATPLPLSPLEGVVAEIWADVLALAPRRVERQDHFFRLGGDSLLSLRAVARMSACLGVDVPLALLWEAPTVGEAARRLDALAVADREAPAPVLRIDTSSTAPLSSAQQRLWIAHQLNPSSVEHNVSAAVWLEGPLDLDALTGSLTVLVSRHETLRTEFGEEDGAPRQRVREDLRIGLEVQDVSAIGGDAELRCVEFARELIRTPFDLRHPPLVRATLLRCSTTKAALVLTLHHIACDGWSSTILMRDLCEAYEALSNGREPRPVAPRMRYVDYAGWHNQSLRTNAAEARLAYWARHLAGARPTSGLVPSRRDPAQARSAFSAVRRVSPSLSEPLRALKAEHGVTLFMVILAAFKALLHHLTGRTDVVFGTDVTDRPLSGTWDVVGFFINQLALRTDVAGDPSFGTLLARVRETCLGAYAHQSVPYEVVVRRVRPGAGNVRQLFDVKLVEQRTPRLSSDIGPLRVRHLDVSSPSSEFEMILNFSDEAEGIAFEAECRSDYLGPERVQRMLAKLEWILTRAAAAPSQRLSELTAGLQAVDQGASSLYSVRRPILQIPAPATEDSHDHARLDGQPLR